MIHFHLPQVAFDLFLKMEMDTPFNYKPWTAGQKIAFRFFFLFFMLQLLTENFMGNLFGDILFIWNLGEQLFTPPCLWLNKHVFHFKYIPQTWTTFSLALQTIREIVYLLLTCLGCGLWTALDRKRTNYNKLLYWFSKCLLTVLSCILFGYGILKIFPVQMASPSIINLHRPVGDLSPFELIWTTFGYGTPYQIFTGIFELFAGIMILISRTRVAGLLLTTAVMLNVIMLNYTYQIGVLNLSFYIFLITLFLLAPYARRLFGFFFTKEQVALPSPAYLPTKNFKSRLLSTMAILFVSVSFILNTRAAYNRYTRVESINQSRQYAVVKNHVVDNDTLKLIESDTLRWRLWSERKTDGKSLVTIATMKPGATKTYRIERDSLAHTLILHPINPKDTASLNFTYTAINPFNWRLEGLIQQKNIKVELQKISPDTILNLLKTKRTIITFDDESDHQ
jgi:hypothetical protein